MPSRDSTGKRIGGTAQQRRAAAHRAAHAQVAKLAPDLAAALPPPRASAAGGDGGDDSPPHPIPFGPPPSDGVEAGVEWIACLQAQVAVLAAHRMDPARVRALGVLAKAVGSARAAASDSERAVRLAAAYLAQTIDVTGEAPPVEPAGLVMWAFWRLLTLAHLTATQEGEVDEAQVAHQARALALLAAVQPQRSIDRLAADAERVAELAAVPLRAVG